jgi:surface protein
MFDGCYDFNADLSNWDVFNVQLTSNMFWGATSFTSNLSKWKVGGVLDASFMFAEASSFDSDLSNGDTERMTNMHSMFSQATSFKGLVVENFNTASVTDMTRLFQRVSPDFNPSGISSWDTSKVMSMQKMFAESPSFNQDLND